MTSHVTQPGPSGKKNLKTRTLQRRTLASAASTWLKRLIVPVGLALVLLLAQSRGSAQTTNAPEFGQNFFVTGDVVAYGVGLKGTGVNGFANGTITIPATAQLGGIPANADPVAAFLYWGTITDQNNLNAGLIGAQFRGNDIGGVAATISPEGTPPCWSAGGATGSPPPGAGNKRTVYYAADVLRFFEIGSNGRVLVNGTSHNVKLPDSGSVGSGGTPLTLGASLVVIYRSPSEPFRSIVLYHGGFTMDQGSESISATIQGFYQVKTSSPQSKLLFVMGDGQSGFSERVQVNNVTVATNPFVGQAGDVWDNPTISVSASALPGNAASAIVTIDHTASQYDCLTGGAFILSTTVQDADEDGIVDVLESSGTSGTISDPTGQLLPNLYAMGARPNQKNLLVEIGALKANAGTTYGTAVDSAGHNHMPTPAVLKRVGDAFKNAPVPIKVLFDVGDVAAYRNLCPKPGATNDLAGAINNGAGYPAGTTAFLVDGFTASAALKQGDPVVITGHTQQYVLAQDVTLDGTGAGTLTIAPPGLASAVIDNQVVTIECSTGSPYVSTEADEYLIATGARGGESAIERACEDDPLADPDADPPVLPRWICPFKDYPGTFTWKVDYSIFRNQPVGPLGEELFPTELDACVTSGNCRRRFDLVRKDLFHYVLFAHASGVPDSPNICVDPATGTNTDGSCNIYNTHLTPRSNAGVGDAPGADALITVGLWGNGFVGSPFVQASAMFHELGHNLGLMHNGDPFGDPPLYEPRVLVEDNCYPNYLSTMNYTFLNEGLIVGTAGVPVPGFVVGEPQIDYSRVTLNPLDENSFSEIAGMTPNPIHYWTRWYAPQTSVHKSLAGTPATRHCYGAPLSIAEINARLSGQGMVRLLGSTVNPGIDWNGDLDSTDLLTQDITFNGPPDSSSTLPELNTLQGSEDWSFVKDVGLRQVGVRTVGGGASLGTFDLWSISQWGGLGNSWGGIGNSWGGIGNSWGGVGNSWGGIGNSWGGLGAGWGGVSNGWGGIGNSWGGVGNSWGGVGNSWGGLGNSWGPDAEPSFKDATSVPNPPHSVKACVLGGGGVPGDACAQSMGTVPLHRNRVDFKAPNAGADNVSKYLLVRQNDQMVVAQVTAVLGQTDYFAVDPGEVPNGQTITYSVRAEYVDDDNNAQTPVPLSGPSNPASVTGVNFAPVAVPDGLPPATVYSVKKNKTITIAAAGILANDTDVDSPAPPTTPYSLRAVLISTPPPSLGTVTLNANRLGGFTFTAGNVAQQVTFTYRVYNTCSLGTTPTPPAPPTAPPQCSGYSNLGTVTITVQ